MKTMSILERCNLPFEPEQIEMLKGMVAASVLKREMPIGSWGHDLENAIIKLREEGDHESAGLLFMCMACMGQELTRAAIRSMFSIAQADMNLQDSRNN